MANPFGNFRKHQKKWIAVIGILTMFSFVVMGSVSMILDNRMRRSVEDPVAVTWTGGEINDLELSLMVKGLHSLRQFLAEIRQAAIQAKGVSQARQTLCFEDANSEQLAVRIRLLATRAEELGLTIGDDYITDYIRRWTDKKLTDAQFKTALRDNNLTEKKLFKLLRQDLLATKLLSLANLGGQVGTPDQQYGYYNRIHRQMDAEVLPVSVEDFLSLRKVTDPTERELLDFFKKHSNTLKNQFSPDPGLKVPYRATFEYLKADFESFVKKAETEVTDKEIQTYYDENKDFSYLKISLPEVKDDPKEKTPEGKKDPEKKDSEKKDPEKKDPGKKKDDPKKKDDAAKKDDKKTSGDTDNAGKPKKTEAAKNKDKKDAKPEEKKGKPEEKKGKPEEKKKPGGLFNLQDDAVKDAKDKKPEGKTDKKTPADSPKKKDDAIKNDKKKGDAKKADVKKDDTTKDDPKKADKPKKEDDAKAKPGEKTPDTAAAKDDPAAKKGDPTAKKADAGNKEAAKKKVEAPPVEYEPLADVRDDIAKRLAERKASETINEIFKKIGDMPQLKNYKIALDDKIAGARTADGKLAPKPTRPDFAAIAKEHGLTAGTTPSLSAYEASKKEGFAKRFSRAFVAGQSREFEIQGDEFPLTDDDGNGYLFWMVNKKNEHVPVLADVRDEAIRQWKMPQARTLASEAAKAFAERVKTGKGLMVDEFKQENAAKVFQPPAFTSWKMEQRFTGRRFPTLVAMPNNDPEDLESTGFKFMDMVSDLNPGEVGVAPDSAESIYYVVRMKVVAVVSESDFVRDRNQIANIAGYERQELTRAWIEDLLKKHFNLDWKREIQ
jgi:hypothetical protein